MYLIKLIENYIGRFTCGFTTGTVGTSVHYPTKSTRVCLTTDVLCDFICLSICYAILFYVHVLFVVITIRSFLLSWLITGFVTRVTGRVLHGEQELHTLPEHMSSPPGFSEVSVRSLFVHLFFFLWLWNYLSFFELMFFCNFCTLF